MNLEIKDLIGEAVNNAIARRNSNDLTILSDEEAAKVEGGTTHPLIAGGLMPIDLLPPSVAGGKPAQPPMTKPAIPISKPIPIDNCCPPLPIGKPRGIRPSKFC